MAKPERLYQPCSTEVLGIFWALGRTYLDGNGDHFAQVSEVEQAERGREMLEAAVEFCGWDAFQNLAIDQEDGPFLKVTAGAHVSRVGRAGRHETQTETQTMH